MKIKIGKYNIILSFRFRIEKVPIQLKGLPDAIFFKLAGTTNAEIYEEYRKVVRKIGDLICRQ